MALHELEPPNGNPDANPGWYPDPLSPEKLRRWDGEGWSPEVKKAEGTNAHRKAPEKAKRTRAKNYEAKPKARSGRKSNEIESRADQSKAPTRKATLKRLRSLGKETRADEDRWSEARGLRFREGFRAGRALTYRRVALALVSEVQEQAPAKLDDPEQVALIQELVREVGSFTTDLSAIEPHPWLLEGQPTPSKKDALDLLALVAETCERILDDLQLLTDRARREVEEESKAKKESARDSAAEQRREASIAALHEDEGDPAEEWRQERIAAASADGMKLCPDCAEEVKEAARKCRFCGFRFDRAEARESAKGKLRKAGKVAEPTAGHLAKRTGEAAMSPFRGRVGGISSVLGGANLDQFKTFLKDQKAHKGYHKEKLGLAGEIGQETPLLAAHAQLAGDHSIGTMVITDRQLVFARKKLGFMGPLTDVIKKESVNLSSVEWAKASEGIRAGTLRIKAASQIWDFRAVRPKGRATEIEQVVRSKIKDKS